MRDSITAPNAFYREAGAGTGVVCLHSSASTSSQWRGLMERLASRFRVLAPDLYGHGRTPPWPDERALTFADEVDLIGPVLAAAGAPIHLVGHSYGGAIALMCALADPGRLASLVLFEPVFFSLVLANDPDQPAAREIRSVRDNTVTAANRGDLGASAEHFVDYWMGAGTWALMPEERRSPVAAAMPAVKAEWRAALDENTPLSAFAALEVRTLYLTGSVSPASTRAVARLLTETLPNVITAEIPGAGHMAPVTHADAVNDAIQAFVEAAP